MIALIKNYKYYLVGMIVFSLILSGMVIGRRISKPAISRQAVYSRMDEIRRIRHLELVTYHYESMVDVDHATKSNKVYLLLIIPSKVSCYIDLELVRFSLEDTLVRITLPEPVIDAPVLELDSARVFNLNERYVTASKSAYETVVKNVQRALSMAKKDVLKRAEANGIKEETSRMAQVYFRSLLAGLGFDVEFNLPASMANPVHDSINMQMSPQVNKGSSQSGKIPSFWLPAYSTGSLAHPPGTRVRSPVCPMPSPSLPVRSPGSKVQLEKVHVSSQSDRLSTDSIPENMPCNQESFSVNLERGPGTKERAHSKLERITYAPESPADSIENLAYGQERPDPDHLSGSSLKQSFQGIPTEGNFIIMMIMFHMIKRLKKWSDHKAADY